MGAVLTVHVLYIHISLSLLSFWLFDIEALYCVVEKRSGLCVRLPIIQSGRIKSVFFFFFSFLFCGAGGEEEVSHNGLLSPSKRGDRMSGLVIN